MKAERTAPRVASWRTDLAALIVLALAALGFFWRVVIGQNWMPADGGDLVSFLYPTYRFAAQQLSQGLWPLWNPFLYGGAPHVGDIQAGFLYPPNLLLFLLWSDFPYSAMQWLSIGHIWWAGVGMYLFLTRRLRLASMPSVAGALAFMLSDAFVVHFGNLNYNAAMSWLPWIFWAYTGGLGDPGTNLPMHAHGLWQGYRSAALAGALLALSALAGHIQATLYILLALALYSLFWLWLGRDRPNAPQRAFTVIGYGALSALLTALLSAPVLLPALQLTGFTSRANWIYQEAAGYSLAPAQWIGWLIPGFFGRGPQYHWGAWPRVESGYIGILTLLLVGVAFMLRRNERTWPWYALAAATFVLSLGVYAIPHGWLTLLPGFGQFRAPARLVLITDFALATLAGVGLHTLLRPLDDADRQRLARFWAALSRSLGTLLLVAVPLAYLALLLVQDRDPAVSTRVSITLLAVMTFAGLAAASLLWLAARRGEWARPVTLGGLAIALILLDLASTGAYQDLGNQNPSRAFAQPALAAFFDRETEPFRIDTRTGIEGAWQPNTALWYGLEDIGGIANPLMLADVGRYWEGVGSRSSRLYDLLNVRYIVAAKDVSLDWSKFTLAYDGDPRLNVYANRTALPRALLVSQIEMALTHEAAWTAIHRPDFDPTRSIVIENAGQNLTGGGTGQVSSIETGTGYLALQTNTDGHAMLLLSQVWYPGWRVWVDGAEIGEPLRANYLFQGVSIGPGTHRVELRFVPPLWRLGWLLMGLTTIALLALEVVWRLTRRSIPTKAT